MVQIIRYTESPVGPYDEMLLVPGFFTYDRESPGKDSAVTAEQKKNLRITKIYVSQKETCYNGRTRKPAPTSPAAIKTAKWSSLYDMWSHLT